MSEVQFQSFGDALDDYIEFAKRPDSGIGTGYSVDETCGRMGPGELGLMWARSSAGKSTLMLNIINNTPDVPTVFFNMEMRARSLAEWLATMTGTLSVSYDLLRELIQVGEEDSRYEAVMQEVAKVKADRAPQVWFVEEVAPTVADLQRHVDRVEAVTGIRPVRVMLDHLSLMYNARDYENVSRTTAELHSWAMADDLALIVAQQTGRGGNEAGQRNDGHIPVTLSSGLYAGEHDADWIWGVWRPEKDPKYRKPAHEFKSSEEYDRIRGERSRLTGLTRFAVIKNRPTGQLCEDGVDLWWNPHTRTLEEALLVV